MDDLAHTDISKTSADLQSRFIKDLSDKSDLAAMMNDLVMEAADVLEADACTVFTVDEGGKSATQIAGSGYQRKFTGKRDVAVVSADQVPERPEKGEALGLTGWMLSSGKPFLARTPEELAAHPHHAGRFDPVQLPEHELKLQSFLGVPFRGLRGEIIGVIKAERLLSKPKRKGTAPTKSFSEQDELALETIAHVASRSIIYHEMARQRQEANAVTTWARDVIAEAAATEGELDSFLDIVVNVTAAAMDADSCGIFLKDESEATLTQRAGSGHQALRKVIRAYRWPDEASIRDCSEQVQCKPADCRFRKPGLFSQHDIINLSSLVNKLRDTSHPVSQFLWRRFTGNEQGLLTDTATSPAERESILVDKFTELIRGDSMYDADRFANVRLSAETRALAGKGTFSSKERLRLNRLLLEDTYPEEIAKRVGLTAWIAATGKSFRARDFAELASHCHHQGQYDLWNFPDKEASACGAFLGIPLHVGGTIIGVIKVENTAQKDKTDPRSFTKEGQQRFEILAQDIALAIMRLQIQIPDRYQIIHRAQTTIMDILRGGLDLPELVNKVVTETRALFHAGACALFLKEGNRLVQERWGASGWAQSGPEVRKYELVEPEAIKDDPAPNEKVGLTVWMAVKQEKFTARSNEELRMHRHHKGTFDEHNFKKRERCESFMGLPLLIKEGDKNILVGVLKVETKTKGEGKNRAFTYFNELDEIVFGLIANRAAIAIQNARLLKARRKTDRELTVSHAWKEFSAMAAHRTGTEAAIIRGSLRWLRKDAEAAAELEGVKQYLTRIQDALDRIDAFVQEFTRFATPPKLKLERLSVNGLCRKVRESFTAEAVQKPRVHLQLDGNLPDIWGDREQLLYSFKEIFQNAIKAMPEGGKLAIITRVIPGKRPIRIEFSDTGPGVPSDDKKKILVPGFRGRPGGTGLGLALVNETIRGHDGHLFEDGEFGRGARFVIELPVAGPSDRKEGVSPDRILIVEDTEILRHDLERIVKWDDPSREVVTATNERQATRLIADQSFDLVVTDVKLDEAGGTETGGLKVVQAIRDKDRATPIIVVTAYGNMEIPRQDGSTESTISVEDEAKRLGCSAFVPRPHPTRDYLDVVREAVARAFEGRANLPNSDEKA